MGHARRGRSHARVDSFGGHGCLEAGGQRLWCARARDGRHLHNLLGSQERGGVSLELPRLGTVHAVANVQDSAQHPGATSNAVWSKLRRR